MQMRVFWNIYSKRTAPPSIVHGCWIHTCLTAMGAGGETLGETGYFSDLCQCWRAADPGSQCTVDPAASYLLCGCLTHGMFTEPDSNWKVKAPDPCILNPSRDQMPSCARVPLMCIGTGSYEGRTPSLAAPNHLVPRSK